MAAAEAMAEARLVMPAILGIVMLMLLLAEAGEDTELLLMHFSMCSLST